MASYALSGSEDDRTVTISGLTDAEVHELWHALGGPTEPARSALIYHLIDALAVQLPINDGNANPIRSPYGPPQ